MFVALVATSIAFLLALAGGFNPTAGGLFLILLALFAWNEHRKREKFFARKRRAAALGMTLKQYDEWTESRS
jgi:O-antigen ligase